MLNKQQTIQTTSKKSKLSSSGVRPRRLPYLRTSAKLQDQQSWPVSVLLPSPSFAKGSFGQVAYRVHNAYPSAGVSKGQLALLWNLCDVQLGGFTGWLIVVHDTGVASQIQAGWLCFAQCVCLPLFSSLFIQNITFGSQYLCVRIFRRAHV